MAHLIPTPTSDPILTAHFGVAWVGERSHSPLSGWRRTDVIGELGCDDLLEQLLHETRRSAAFRGARGAARMYDEADRKACGMGDRLTTHVGAGAEVDERIEERLADLNATQPRPAPCPALQQTPSPSRNRGSSFELIDAFRPMRRADIALSTPPHGPGQT